MLYAYGRIYNPRKPSLSDAVVSFGGFCSGVMVSDNGLLLTNHHCGLSAIARYSSTQNDYLQEGFVAYTLAEELPQPDLFVRFLVYTENVTERFISKLNPDMDQTTRSAVIDSISASILQEITLRDSTLTPVVDPLYGKSEFLLSVYRDFEDVRLVFAPPSCVGQFGKETDNWTWPRHAGDFCVFRIYADADNNPAPYSPANVPYRPLYVAPVSLEGYKPGSFTMTIGYPADTERYLSSYGLEHTLSTSFSAKAHFREIKQRIWKRYIDANPATRVKYATKYDMSANYWKNSLGMARSVSKLKVLERKKAIESGMVTRALQQGESSLSASFLSDLEQAYLDIRPTEAAREAFVEVFFNASDLLLMAIRLINFDGNSPNAHLQKQLIMEQLTNVDTLVDKEVFVSMLTAYQAYVPDEFLPPLYHQIDSIHYGNTRAFVDTLYDNTQVLSPAWVEHCLEKDSLVRIYEDPAVNLGLDLFMYYYEMGYALSQAYMDVERGEQLLSAAYREMNTSQYMYPEANSTMRLSFGSVHGYESADAVYHDYYTTTEGIIQKASRYAINDDYYVQPELYDLLATHAFPSYAGQEGHLNVCFITNNDITGGNSGSAVFNAKGELLGLAFDGNWEALCSDFLYQPSLQRCLCVDIRYILFIMQRYGNAGHLLHQMGINLPD